MVYERPQYNGNDCDSEMFFGESTDLCYAINRASRKKFLWMSIDYYISSYGRRYFEIENV